MARQQRARLQITHGALLKRINRALQKDGEQLRKNRGGPGSAKLPAYIRVAQGRNGIVGGCDDLETFARELRVLADWEELAKEAD
jgi:hypothetical protein